MRKSMRTFDAEKEEDEDRNKSHKGDFGVGFLFRAGARQLPGDAPGTILVSFGMRLGALLDPFRTNMGSIWGDVSLHVHC